MSRVEASRKSTLVWSLVVLLGVAHYDFWYWLDTSLVFGFLPIGLFYHALISLLCGVAWALVVKYAWPSHIEEWAGAEDEPTAAEVEAR